MPSVQVVTSTTKAASYDALAKPFLALGSDGAIPQGDTGTQFPSLRVPVISEESQPKRKWPELVEWLDFEWKEIRDFLEKEIREPVHPRCPEAGIWINKLWVEVLQPHFIALEEDATIAAKAALEKEAAIVADRAEKIEAARALKTARGKVARKKLARAVRFLAKSARGDPTKAAPEKATQEHTPGLRRAGRGQPLLLKKSNFGKGESAEAAPCIIKLYKQSIPIYSVHCALAAILTLLLPRRECTKNALVYQYCLVLLLGKWSSRLHFELKPAVVCVMRGGQGEDEVWMCGTTKKVPRAGKEAKTGWRRKPGDDNTPDPWPTEWTQLLKEWRKQRSDFINERIGDHPYGGDLYGPNGDRSAIHARLNGYRSEAETDINGADDAIERRERYIMILENCLERLSRGRRQDDHPTNAPIDRTQIGDCAESWGIGVMAALNCTVASEVVSIAMRQPDLGLVESAHFKSPKVSTEHELILPNGAKARLGCNNCQYLFAVLHVNKSVDVKDNLMINGKPVDALEIQDLATNPKGVSIDTETGAENGRDVIRG